MSLLKSRKKDNKIARIDSVLNIKLDEDTVIEELRDFVNNNVKLN